MAKDLYPEFEGITLETYAKDLLEGRGKKVYEHILDLPSIKAANKALQ